MLAETAITILQRLGYQVHARDFGLVNLYNESLQRSIRLEGTMLTTIKDGDTKEYHPVLCNVFGLKEKDLVKKIKALK